MNLLAGRRMRRTLWSTLTLISLAGVASGAEFTVTNEAELAQAIADANANPGADLIVVDTPDGVNTVIALTGPLPEIAGDLTVAGEGEDAVRISGADMFRVFFVKSGDVTFRDLTIGDGFSLGFDGGNSSSAGGGGGPAVGAGIYVRSGRTFLERVTVDNCHVIGGSGGTISGAGNGGGGGAGFAGAGSASAANVGGDGGGSGVFEGLPGMGGPAADGMSNPNGTAGGTGAGGGGGGGAIEPNAGGGDGAPGGFLGGGGGGGAGSATGRSGRGGNGGLGAGGGGAGLDLGGGSGAAGASAGFGGAGGNSVTGFGNGGGGGAGLGGAIFVDVDASVVTTDVVFSNNSATGGPGGDGGDAGNDDDDGGDGLGKGGAVFVISGSILGFQGALVFENNAASDAGTGGDNDNFFGAVIPLEEDDGGGSGGCFIATAAFGTPLADDVEVLRRFRDEYLMSTSVGLVMADAYYRLSPAIADDVARQPVLAALVRLALIPVVLLAGVLVSPYAAPVAVALSVGALATVVRRRQVRTR